MGIPSVSASFDLYDDMNIFESFCKIIERAQDMEMIKVEIQKADVVSRFLMKNKILMDAIQRLYRGMRRQIGLIDAELKRKKYPKEIILLIIGYLLNYERPLIISFEG